MSALSIKVVRAVFVVMLVVTLVSVELIWVNHPNNWGPETQVTFGSGDSRIVDLVADNAGKLYLAWEDNRNGSSQVYYQDSTDNGLTWRPEIKVSNVSSHTIDPLPRLASVEGRVLLFFSGGTGSGEHLLYAVSSDSGSTFSPQRELTADAGYQTNSAVSVNGATVNLVWQNYVDGNEHVYYMKSLDAGADWSPESALTVGAVQDRHPAITAFGKNVFVAWTRYNLGEDALFFRASNDEGAHWSPEVQLSDYQPQGYSIFPSIGTNGTRVDIVWNSGQVLFVRSPDAGVTWGPIEPLTNKTREYLAPRISTLGSSLQVVVAGISIEGNNALTISSDIYYFESGDGGISWHPPVSLTNHPARLQSLAPAIAARPDATFVAWEDNRNDRLSIFLRDKPDFAALQVMERQLVNYASTILILAAAAYVLLEMKQRRKKPAKIRRRRVRKRTRLSTRKRTGRKRVR